MSKSTSTREDRAAQLLAAGAVSLYVGRGYAVVANGRGGEYTVTKTACTCADFTRRGVDCKHRLVVKQICAEYRALKSAATRGETVKPSAALMQALRWSNRTPAPAPAVEASTCCECGAAIRTGKTCTDCLDKALFGPVAA